MVDDQAAKEEKQCIRRSVRCGNNASRERQHRAELGAGGFQHSLLRAIRTAGARDAHCARGALRMARLAYASQTTFMPCARFGGGGVQDSVSAAHHLNAAIARHRSDNVVRLIAISTRTAALHRSASAWTGSGENSMVIKRGIRRAAAAHQRRTTHGARAADDMRRADGRFSDRKTSGDMAKTSKADGAETKSVVGIAGWRGISAGVVSARRVTAKNGRRSSRMARFISMKASISAIGGRHRNRRVSEGGHHRRGA